MKLVKFNSGSRGRVPVGSGGFALRSLRFFFHFQKVIVVLKRGEASIISGRFRGAAAAPFTGGGRKRGCSPPPPPPVSATVHAAVVWKRFCMTCVSLHQSIRLPVSYSWHIITLDVDAECRVLTRRLRHDRCAVYGERGGWGRGVVIDGAHPANNAPVHCLGIRKQFLCSPVLGEWDRVGVDADRWSTPVSY